METSKRIIFPQKDIKKILSGKMTSFSTKSSVYNKDELYKIYQQEENILIGEIRILSKSRHRTSPSELVWVYGFILEFSEADKRTFLKKLEDLGYI